MKTLRPSSSSALRACRIPQPPQLRQQRRTFLPNPFTHPSSPLSTSNQKPATLTASRVLPYAHNDLFNIIADVPSYATFLPYCQRSTVTKWSAADAHGKRWPSEATLVVGYVGVHEGFQSKVYCVAPGEGKGNTGVGIVEAVSGNGQTRLGPDLIAHHLQDAAPSEGSTQAEAAEGDSGLLTHLLTRWTLRPFMFKPPPGEGDAQPRPQDKADDEALSQTECSVSIEYAFANPIYGAMSAGAAPFVAERMIQAFEERVKDVLGESAMGGNKGPGRGGTGERGGLEGVVGRG